MNFEEKYNCGITEMFEHYILDKHWEYNAPERMRTVLSDIVKELRTRDDYTVELGLSIKIAESAFFRNEQRL